MRKTNRNRKIDRIIERNWKRNTNGYKKTNRNRERNRNRKTNRNGNGAKGS